MAQTLLKFIKEVARRLIYEHLIKYGLLGMAAGFLLTLTLLIVGRFIIIPNVLMKAVALIIGGALIGMIYGYCHAPKNEEVALLIDQTGLEERVSTALMLINDESEASRLQRSDTIGHIKRYDIKKHFPIHIPVQPLILNGVLFLVCFGMFLLPAKAKQREKTPDPLETVLESLEKNAATKQLAEQFKKSQGETDSNEIIKQLQEQYEGMSQVEKEALKDTLKNAADEVKDPSLKKQLETMSSEAADGKLNAEQLEKLLHQLQQDQENEGNPQGNQSQGNEGNPQGNQSQGNEGNPQGNQSQGNEGNPQGNQSQGNEGNPQGNQSQGNEGNPQGNQSQGNEGNPQGNQSQGNEGNPQGNQSQGNEGNPQGDQNQGNEGNTQGGQSQRNAGNAGNGQNGSGDGWGKGSKKGKEKADNGEEGNSSLDQNNTGYIKQLQGQDDDAQFDKRQEIDNGINIKGSKVDYHEVVKDYTDQALENMEHETIPEHLKDTVKDYFDGINQ